MHAIVRRETPSPAEEPVTWRRALLAAAAVFAGFATVGYLDSPLGSSANSVEDYVLLSFAFTALVAPFLTRIRHLVAQIFARGVLLQLTFFGVLVGVQNMFVTAHTGRVFLSLALMGSGLVPLVILGRRGLEMPSKAFRPVAYRRTMLASLLFGLADLWALLLYSVFDASVGLCLGAAGLMGVAIFGLYRMKVWGLMLCIFANFVIAGAALSGILDLPEVLVGGLATTAGIQLLLPLPIVAAIFRTRAGARR